VIVGYLSNIENEMALYPTSLQLGLKFLLETDLSTLALGRHDIQGSTIFAMVSEYETQPKEQRRPEAHNKYLDIQYICSGEEMIGSSPLEAACGIDEDCLDKRDVIYYKTIAPETQLILLQGMFAVYFPWDAHRPNCSIGEKACKVRKVVVKIAMDSLDINVE
jgi:YhcH/YjgK/YiaL family protein